MAAIQLSPQLNAAAREEIKSSAATIINVVAVAEGDEDLELPAVPVHQVDVRDTDHRMQSKCLAPLITASLITTDFDALRFDAAASLQILKSQDVSTSTPKSHLLISSPYNDPDHLLDLRRLDNQPRLLSLALSFMKPIVHDYATADYLSSFNWNEVLEVLRTMAKAESHRWKKQSFYTVIFRSEMKKGIDEQRLHDLDKTSHYEAVVSGGLLKYWFGKRDANEKNLATCIWVSREDAIKGGAGPDHAEAMRAATGLNGLYKRITFTRWRLIIGDDATDIKLEKFVVPVGAAARGCPFKH